MAGVAKRTTLEFKVLDPALEPVRKSLTDLKRCSSTACMAHSLRRLLAEKHLCSAQQPARTHPKLLTAGKQQ